MAGQTLLDKLWERNLVRAETKECPGVLHAGLHLVHEVTSPQAFSALDERGIEVRRPDLTIATIDHSVPTLPTYEGGALPYATEAAKQQVEALRRNCGRHGIELLDIGDPRRGIVHLIGPELGRTRPGIVVVCGDSHTSTHGAFGALGFGIGTTEVGHVLATQCLFQRKPKNLRVSFRGTPPASVTAKDLALAVVAELGMEGGTGFVIEYQGEAVSRLSMEGRMTLCNLSIEAGARAGLIAPDETTLAYLEERNGLPQDRDAARRDWLSLASDKDAVFDKDVTIDAAILKPMVSYGVSPHEATAAGGRVPAGNDSAEALAYMDLEPGQPLRSIKVDRVFIGSCTNGRLEDLEAAARVLAGRRVASGMTMLVVPGSEAVKRAAEARNLHRIFLTAGAQWREPGCSMCIAMNGDRGEPGEVVVSTSNRNFRGRQGQGVRTILASPATAAASAVLGHVCDTSALEGEAQE